MSELLSHATVGITAAAFIVGVVVGLTGMGGGALMTPALILLGVGGGAAATVVTADLTAAAVYKTAGAVVHAREGSAHIKLAGCLAAGSVPMAFLGPWLVKQVAVDTGQLDHLLKLSIGITLLFAAATYGVRLWVNLQRVRRGESRDPEPRVRPLATVLVGALGGLLVGVTSVGSGSVIMICLLVLYPGLRPVKLVGTDLVQAVPLVVSAAIANISIHGLAWSIVLPLIVGSVPGTMLGSRVAPLVSQSYIRRGIVIVLTMSGVALLYKSGWTPLGTANDAPSVVAGVGLTTLVLVPVIWGFIRRAEGLPMFGNTPRRLGPGRPTSRSGRGHRWAVLTAAARRPRCPYET